MKKLGWIAIGLHTLCYVPQAGAQASEARFGLIALSNRQNVLGTQGLAQSSASITGIEFLARGDAAGIYGRYLTGTLGNQSFRGADGRLRMGELRFMLGPPLFSVEGGYVLRARAGSLSDNRDKLVRLGIRSSTVFGPTGLSLSLTVGAYVRSDSVLNTTTSGTTPDKKFGLVGLEASTGVFYQFPRGIPLFVGLGYRYERIRSEQEYIPVTREELSGVLLTAGVRYMGRKKPKATAPSTTPPTP
jgi:hypothetical protein